MAAGHTARANRTRLAVEILSFFAVPGTAGDLVCTGVKLATDRIISVACATHTNGVVSASDLFTDEFLPDTHTSCTASATGIKANDQINNTGGTSTANLIVLVTVARGISSPP
jgi:hypothetical protein